MDDIDSNNPAGELNLPVLIIGAGQSGLMLGARLSHMGIKAVLLDRNARVGDSWRKRYRSVTMHSPIYTDHFPFLKFPENWPRFLQPDRICRFVESYAELMELDIRTSCTVTSVQYDGAKERYKVHYHEVGGDETVIHARHVVGVFSDDPDVPNLPGSENFKGELYHSSEHTSASDITNVQDKRVVVIGCSNSGHDVSQDFVNHGAKSVAMIQRNAIFSVSGQSFEQTILALWNMEGLSTEQADLVGNLTPLAIIRSMSIRLTQLICGQDKDMIDGLRRAGFALRTGEDGYGIADHQLIKGGHFYIDQGAIQMIINGKIKVHHCKDGVRELREGGLVLADGTEIDADIIVLATGFHRNIMTVERLMGVEIADKLDNFGGLDHENERVGWWRPTGVPGFWYMTGSFTYCRQFSHSLALQIVAVEKGYNLNHYSSI